MNEKKLKIAFLRIKNDYDALSSKLRDMQMQLDELSAKVPLGIDIEKSLRKLDKVDLEKFTSNLENEFANINKTVSEFNNRFIETGEVIKKFSIELEKYNVEIEDIRKHLMKTRNTTANTDLDLSLMNEKFEEYQELLREKVDLEMSAMRLEFTEEMARLYDMVDKKLNEREQNPEYGKKGKNGNGNAASSSSQKTEEKKESGKIKKAMRWLIDGEDEIYQIKSEVKKGNNNKK